MPDTLFFLIACLGTASERAECNIQTMHGAEQRLWNLCERYDVQSVAYAQWLAIGHTYNKVAYLRDCALAAKARNHIIYAWQERERWVSSIHVSYVPLDTDVIHICTPSGQIMPIRTHGGTE